ncbi:MAG: regulatory iron-sulfur-containing complex subunit RicT [Bacteriovoracaceae bacterium]
MKAVGVQFRSGIKIYEFIQTDLPVNPQDLVLVETGYGEEIGKVIYTDRKIGKNDEVPQHKVDRILTEAEIERLAYLREKNNHFLDTFKERISKYRLSMKPVDLEFSLDEQQVTFYFTSEARVDFRELVRDLSRALKLTVILRQMGQRDEARILSGFGPCGKSICCGNFLTKLENITMDMVREQYEGTRNASKVSGICGRLMCCLAFEDIKKSSKKESKK